jgi:hypothetical protein
LYKVVTDTEMFDSIAETLGIMWLAMGYSILASRFCFPLQSHLHIGYHFE